jgi:hypothetical protein
MNGISLTQIRMLPITGQCMGALSCIASAYIVKSVLQDPQKRKNTYHRIMLFMSITDFITTFFLFFLGTWPIPRGYHVFAVGNVYTCDTVGFISTWGIITGPFFKCSLATYYLLLMKYNWRSRKFGKIEKWLIGLPITAGLVVSIIGLSKKVYGPIINQCW